MFSHWTKLTLKQKVFLAAWGLALVTVGVVTESLLVNKEETNLRISNLKHRDRIDPNATESGRTEPERTPPAGHENDVSVEVKTGVYVDRVASLSVRDSVWTADFYIWFNWTDERIRPGDTFHVVHGEILSRHKLAERTNGGQRYALYRVVARITKPFDTSRFPRDDHLLTVTIEDSGLQSYQMRYVADDANCGISSRVTVAGYSIWRTSSVVKPHSYRTSRGDPDLPSDYRATFSQFIYAMWLVRPNWGLYFRMFLTLFAALLIAMIGYFTSPTHRMGLAIGSFFGAVANTYITSTIVPETGIATLADVINGIGVATITAVLFQTIISQYLHDKRKDEAFSRAFDDVTMVLIVVLVWLNVSVPMAASLQT